MSEEFDRNCGGWSQKEIYIQFDFGQIVEELGQLYLVGQHGGCPVYLATKRDQSYKISRITNKCKAYFPYKAPLKLADLKFFSIRVANLSYR